MASSTPESVGAMRRQRDAPAAQFCWLIEEKEMAARFDEAYLAYRRRVPFIIPRLRRRG